MFQIVTMSDSLHLSLAWLEKEVRDLVGLFSMILEKSEDIGGSNSERKEVRLLIPRSIY